MTAARACLAVAVLLQLLIEQTDCLRAYVQAKLEGPPTWVGLPRAWWPKSWIDKGFLSPVCRLIFALYGHPLAGDYWGKHLATILKKFGLSSLDGWPGLY